MSLCVMQDCPANQGASCLEGHGELTACRHWRAAAVGQAPESDSIPSSDAVAYRPQWTGYALGTSELDLVVHTGRALLFGLVGHAKAGKSSLLCGLYAQMLRGARLGAHRFAGSYTLASWHDLIRHTRQTVAHLPRFPPQTSQQKREPGLLHLAARQADGPRRELLFTDAPGPWFTTWMHEPRAEAAVSANWIIRRADTLVVLADSDRLSGEHRGAARNDLFTLFARLSDEGTDRPVILCWSKSDIDVSARLSAAVNGCFADYFGAQALITETSVKNPTSITDLVARCLTAGTEHRAATGLTPPRVGDDPFLLYRGVR